MVAERPTAADRREFLLRVLRLGGLRGRHRRRSARGCTPAARRPSEPAVLRRGPPHGRCRPTRASPSWSSRRATRPRPWSRRALDELGGIRRFVARGDVVVVKPNIGWDRAPEQAANTNPELVAAVVRLCQEAGARKVIVTDVSCNDARVCFDHSGIAAAAAGGRRRGDPARGAAVQAR